MRAIALLVLVLLAGVQSASAQDEPKTASPRPAPGAADAPPATLRSPGRIRGRVWVGDPAPDFVLDGSNQRPIKLSSLRGRWMVIAVADRGTDLRPLRALAPELRQMGAGLAGVVHEKARTIEHMAVRDTVPFLMLADVTGEVASMYGLYDDLHSITSRGLFILDRAGVIRQVLLGPFPPAEQIVQLARFAITGL